MSEYNPQQEEQQEEDGLEQPGNTFLIFNVMPSWLVSFIIHILLIIILAVAYWTIPGQETVGLVTGEPAEEISDMEQLDFQVS